MMNVQSAMSAPNRSHRRQFASFKKSMEDEYRILILSAISISNNSTARETISMGVVG